MAVVESVVALVVEKLSEALVQEAIRLHEVGNQVEWMKDELNCMQSFLKDADAKQEGDERVKNWVRAVRDLAYDVEDIIDTFVSEIAPVRRPGFIGSIKRATAFIGDELMARHKLASQIERTKNTIHSISERRLNYGIQNIGMGEGTSSSTRSSQDWRLTSPNVEEHDFVGFEKDLKTLVARLIDMGEPRRCVVSVVGMGGLGKTTITRKVYNTNVVRRHFHSHAWISVSQEYVARDLLHSIIKCCVPLPEAEAEKVEKMNIVELRDKLFEYLKGKRYLIVLDDIWKYEVWDAVKDAFPDMKNGSRILLTTRNKDVALYADARCPPHELRFLTDDESWELFCKKTFLAEQGTHCPQNLQKIGTEIVKRCHGLPLAIVVIGGLLSRKEPREWGNVLKSISWQFVEGQDRLIMRILSLSYKDLPYHLKPCFLYLGIFPEDDKFCTKKLIRLWVAEGFLQQRGDETPEEVGEDCLKELVQRSMVQVAEIRSVGGIKRCRMHDLLRDLCISEAKVDKFLEIHHENMNNPTACSARRLAVHHNAVENFASLKCSTPCLRSMLISTKGELSLERKQEKFLYRGFKLLRVLDLRNVYIKKLPTEIGELVHLRYLGCTCTGLTRLPPSIGNLVNLQSLYLRSDFSVCIPSTIGKMRQLRHLQVKYTTHWSPMRSQFMIDGHPRLDEMSNLQTLADILAGKWVRDCLGKLNKLRKLGIGFDSNAYVKEVQESIVKLDGLESLFLSSEHMREKMLALAPLTDLHKLCKLYLLGRIEKLPESYEFPTNLTMLTLECTHLEQDPLQTLEKLENLRILKLLRYAYVGKEMACSSQGFPRLESLNFHYLENLEEWTIEEGTLPSLLHLRISTCYKLMMLPEGLQHVISLKKLVLWGTHSELKDRLRKDDGEDWHKIQNIPSIDNRWWAC